MEMDKAPLNRAHQLERKAETLNRQTKLDECIQCHTEAVELYKKCLQIGENKNALESIQLQKEWNEKQIRLLQLKKSYLERTEREKNLNGITPSKHTQKEAVENLEAKIFRNFETHDSLICYLANRGIIGERYCQTTIEETPEKDESPFVVGKKHPKPDSTIIEELKELSGQLRESVQEWLIRLDEQKKRNEQLKEHILNLELEHSYREGLLIQLDDRNKEIEQLKAHIKDLELEKSDKDENSSEKGRNEPTSPLTPSAIPDLSDADFKSLPSLEALAIQEIDLSVFKEFRIPKVSRRLLPNDD